MLKPFKSNCDNYIFVKICEVVKLFWIMNLRHYMPADGLYRFHGFVNSMFISRFLQVASQTSNTDKWNCATPSLTVWF